MTHYRLTPLKPGGWHRLGLLAALGLVPLTVMLWTTDAFGGGEIGVQSALIFLGCGLVLVALLSFGLGWAFRGFAVRTHAEGEDEDRDHGRPRGTPAPHAVPSHAPAAKKAAAHH
ncbi:hypothetical protein C882_0478 [Caenispirillum salinarum AK4]|uniref:Uncharacterized protein n=1 Tax=Caenispirillum salinarum AK4 TaxID=1238182 RepID=K9HKU6_9PROT|nr:hypothetical protein [Caenispirillum salinarum]EKV29171.1 hypothetical protein C882_0478 [Caenispirillum salinarum AK4]